MNIKSVLGKRKVKDGRYNYNYDFSQPSYRVEYYNDRNGHSTSSPANFNSDEEAIDVALHDESPMPGATRVEVVKYVGEPDEMGYRNLETIFSKKLVSDSRRVKDSAASDAEKLKDMYDTYVGELEEMRSNYFSGVEDTSTVADWEDAFRLLINEIGGMEIENPQDVHDILENDNWHRLNWCLYLAGVLGQDGVDYAVDFLKGYQYDDKSYLALKNIAINDYGGKVSDSRRVKDGLTRSERYNRSMERIFATAERFDQNQMKWLREQGVSEDEIQNAKRNTGLHGSELSKLVLRIARENGDKREDSKILGEAMGISDSRVSDAYLNTYGYEDNGGYYGEDFELADEDDDEVIGLMNGYLELEEQFGIDLNESSVEEIKDFYYAVIDMASKFSFSNPQYIDDELTDANYHTLNKCITIAGLLGKDEQERLVNSFKRDIKYIKAFMDLPRNAAFIEIMQDMGLI